jgi:hypothetical protein
LLVQEYLLAGTKVHLLTQELADHNDCGQTIGAMLFFD